MQEEWKSMWTWMCLNCQNVPVTNSEKASGVEQVEESDINDDSATDDDALDDKVDEIMEQVFGSYGHGDGLPTDEGTDIRPYYLTSVILFVY